MLNFNFRQIVLSQALCFFFSFGEMVSLTVAQRDFNFLSDIDECSSNSHSCDVNAVCNNTRGFYTCACKPGYSGDGKNCTGKLVCKRSTIKYIDRKKNTGKGWDINIRLFAYRIARVFFVFLFFCNFQIGFFPRFAIKIFPVIPYWRNYTAKPHTQNLVDVIYFKRLFK